MTHPRSEHENKFDRQMRLWGGHGQASLESSHVCVLHSGATSTEALKNLVLPNVGAFTLVDDALVTREDVGSNFFVDEDSEGQSRAEVVTRWLREMNGDVKGTALHTNVDALVASNLPFFNSFNLVIASQLSRSTLLRLSSYLYSANIPLVALRTSGLIGLARLQVREHLIVESHPTNDRFDLYIHPEQLSLWPELQRFIDSFILADKPEGLRTEPPDDLTPVSVDGGPVLAAAPVGSTLKASKASSTSSPYLNGAGLDSEEHAHIPYVVILGHLMRRWLSSHSSVPSTYEEKAAFKRSIIAASWDYANETNFAEAVEFAHRAYDRPSLDARTAAVYADPKTEVNRESDPYWLIVAALRRFIEREGHGFALPVSVDIPDMHSKTEWYVQLKALFKARSERDTAAVIAHLHAILAELGLDSSDPRLSSSLSDSSVAHMVKHCRALRVVRTRSIEAELSDEGPSSHTSTAISSLLEEAAYDAMDAPPPAPDQFIPPNPPLIHWYLALRAVDEWRERKGRWPGLLTEREVSAVEKRGEEGGEGEMEEGGEEAEWEVEGREVVSVLNEVWAKLGLEGSAEESCAMEVVRGGGCEPHVVAAWMGGVGAQISLKLLLRQYVPINHTLIFNACHCSAQTWNL